MPVQLPIFGISGLRGIVGDDLFPETIANVAAGFGAFTGTGPVALGRDSRTSGEMFAAAAAAGLTSAGCEVIDLGICPTPTVLHYTKTHELAGGIVITASHNPDRWNGMKFCGRGGVFLSAGEVVRFKALLDSGAVPRVEWQKLKPARKDSGAVAAHVAAIAASGLFRTGRGRRLRVGVDAVNGAASAAAPQMVEAMGCEPVCVYCDSSPETLRSGFPRRPEPMPDHLSVLCSMVREKKLDLGIAFDPDGDRFSCVDETGTPLGEEATIVLACRYVLPKEKARNPKSEALRVVVNLSTTRAVEDVCAEFGARVERTPVGEIQVIDKMRSVGAVLGGEGNGGVILPEVNCTRDGLVAAAIVLNQVRESGGPLSAIRQSLPQYRMAKTTVQLGRKAFDERGERLLAAFAGMRADRQDGLRLDGEDCWIHVRPSNTEPLVRIIAEARTQKKVDELVRQAQEGLTGNGREKE